MKYLLILLLISEVAFSQRDTIPTFNGTKISYFSNGKIKSKIEYKNGKANGKALTYQENGNVLEEGTFVSGRWEGNYKFYYQSGKVQQSFNFDSSGKRSGLQKFYYKNGIIQMLSTFNKGKQDGYYLEFDTLGRLAKTEGRYMNGKKVTEQNKEMLSEMLEIVRKENEEVLKLKKK